MPFPPVWAVIFFFMMILIGIDSQVVRSRRKGTNILHTVSNGGSVLHCNYGRISDAAPSQAPCDGGMLHCRLLAWPALVHQRGRVLKGRNKLEILGGLLLVLPNRELLCRMVAAAPRRFRGRSRRLGVWPASIYGRCGDDVRQAPEVHLGVLALLLDDIHTRLSDGTKRNRVHFFIDTLQAICISMLAQIQRMKVDGKHLPDWAEALGWLMALSSIAMVPIFALYQLIKRREDVSDD